MRPASSITARRSCFVPLVFFGATLLGCSRGPTGGGAPRDFFTDPNVISLVLASERGDVKEIDRLVSLGTNVNARGKDGITPLYFPMWAKNKAGFLRLLEHGANPNLQLTGSSGVGSSVTNDSARAENDSEWLEIVLKHGGNPNLVNPQGSGCKNSTPIFEAVRSRRAKNLDLLIEAGAKIDYQDACGDTAMIYAAGANYFDSVYRLLEAGADYRIRNTNGHDVVDWIVWSNCNPKSELGQWREKAVDFLKGKGVDFDARRARLTEKNKAKSS
jgi:hypothetical protein